jgi:hypothetical protein
MEKMKSPTTILLSAVANQSSSLLNTKLHSGRKANSSTSCISEIAADSDQLETVAHLDQLPLIYGSRSLAGPPSAAGLLP